MTDRPDNSAASEAAAAAKDAKAKGAASGADAAKAAGHSVDAAKAAVAAAKADAAAAVTKSSETAASKTPTASPARIRVADTPPPPRPGTPAAEPAVQEARKGVESARADLSGQITRFQATGRETFDIKTQLSRLPGRIKEDPKRYAAYGAAVAGTIFGLRFLRGGRRKAQAGTLPVEVEEALAGMGKDSDKIRKALDQSFVRYLEAHGAVEPAGARLSRNVALVLVPVATTVIREALKRGAPQKAAAAMRERRGGGGGGPTDPEV